MSLEHSPRPSPEMARALSARKRGPAYVVSSAARMQAIASRRAQMAARSGGRKHRN